MCVCVFRPGQSLLYKFLWKLIYIGQRIDQHHERRPKVEHVLASEACSMACQMTEIATRTETHLRPIAICFERFLNLLPLRVRNGRQNPFRIFVRVILVFFLFHFSSPCSAAASSGLLHSIPSLCWHLLHRQNAAEHNLRVILSVKWFKLTFFLLCVYVRATVTAACSCCCYSCDGCCRTQSDQ